MRRRRWFPLAAYGVLCLAVLATGYVIWIYARVRGAESGQPPRPSSAIVVFGAAEYNGHPSPALRGRLRVASRLFRQGWAPEVIVTGGAGGDPRFSEAGVGAAWLRRHGVPVAALRLDLRSASTPASVRHVTALLPAQAGVRILVVSDGYHLFRLEQLFAAAGIRARGIPAQARPPGNWRWHWRECRQVLAYMLARLGWNV